MRRWSPVVVALALLATATTAAAARVDLIMIDGTINPASDDFIGESIATSARDGAVALVIQLDTPGGLLTSTKHIVKEILGAPVPVIVYVAPAGASASSAGVFVTMAGHVAAMAPGTTIGAAHPVGPGGSDVGGDMREKIENFTVSFGQSIAERRGRNVAWAEKAVRESVSITEKQAVEKKVVDVVAPDLKSLFAQIDGREVQVGDTRRKLALGPDPELHRLEMRLKDRLLDRIADPNIAYLLFMAGVLGLYFEFAHPGVVFPGVAGSICLLLALAAFQVLPINATGMLLLLIGIAMLIAEIFVASFGVLGVGGVAAFVFGSLLPLRRRRSHDGGAPADHRVGGGDGERILPGASDVWWSGRRRGARPRARRPRRRARRGARARSGNRQSLRARGVLERGERRAARGRRARRGDVGRARHARPRAPGRATMRRVVWVSGPLLTALLFVAVFVVSGLKVLREYERAVVFRLGRLVAHRGPGIIYVIPVVEKMLKMDLRTITMDIPSQDVITKDNVSVKVNAVLYFRVIDPNRAVVEVENYLFATSQLAQTTLRSVCGEGELDELLAEREKINSRIQSILDSQTEPWGIKVVLVELKHIDLPEAMQRAMARQAEAERERRAQGDRGRGRVPGRPEDHRRGADHRDPPGRDSAALSADARRGRIRQQHDDDLPGADRSARAAAAARRSRRDVPRS